MKNLKHIPVATMVSVSETVIAFASPDPWWTTTTEGITTAALVMAARVTVAG